jgi:hypothetical protein
MNEVYKFNRSSKDGSDSGEDFDYGEEEETGDTNNVDLMEYISNLDVSNIQGVTQ